MSNEKVFCDIQCTSVKTTVSECVCFVPIRLYLLSEETVASDPVFKWLLLAAQHVVELHSESVGRRLKWCIATI